MLYRPLSTTEIEQLLSNGCRADNWQQITVKDGFVPNSIRQTTFIGQVQLGFSNPGKGISMTTLQNCTIEDNVVINQVGLIQNYIVRSHATIEFCGTLKTTDHPTFGNGIKIEAVNEGGGREVLLYTGLTAQTAYLLAFMRHRPKFVESLENLIRAEIKNEQSETGVIGHHAHVRSVTTLHDVMVGDYAAIEGASILKNGTINSSSSAPTYIGHGVMAYDFIASYGSKIDNGSILKKCFVGEACAIDRQFSAENSLFFANSQMYNGEACSVFAAPYSVSHHKSTLLIATYCGFLNVGSGSNQSNHMYKLGPVHQGILERGCKLGSDSYILWPAKIGVFTFVTGRHYSNPDIADFPFSYLMDDEGTSQLVPGANLRSVGTLRDAAKWPQRDGRKGPKSDLIRFDLFNPHTISAVARGKKALLQIEETQKADNGFYSVGDVRIKKPALKRGIDVYDEALNIYIGNKLIDVLLSTPEAFGQPSAEETLQDQWADLAGLPVNLQHLNELVVDIENRAITSIAKVHKQLQTLYEQSCDIEWRWLKMRSVDLLGCDLSTISTTDLLKTIDKWEVASTKFLQMLLKDAQKEFSEKSKTGYGIGNEPDVRQADFEYVRGRFDTNSFVTDIHQQLANIKEKTKKTKEAIQNLR